LERGLVVSSSTESAGFIGGMLKRLSCTSVAAARSVGEARQLLIENDYDVAVINAPLPDETGEAFARGAIGHGIGQILLLVPSEYLREMAAHVENAGILTVGKPINQDLLWNALTLARAAANRIDRALRENRTLERKIDDIRIISRAKCVLSARFGFTEEEAHKALERQAMDARVSMRVIAERILKTYEL
jgi:response regulator NasT